MTSRIDTTGPHQAWPSKQRRSVDRLMSWGLLWVAFVVLTTAGAFVFCPVEVTWRHYLVAVLFLIQGLILLRISWRLITTVIRGKGRRRWR